MSGLTNDSSLSMLKEEVSIWEKNRNNYRGWIGLTIPRSNSIWCYTKDWLLAIQSAWGSLDALEKLKTCCELSWRFDRSYMPLWDDIVSTMIEPLAFKEIQEGEVKKVEEAKVLQLSILKSLLRYCRETFRIALFSKTKGSILVALAQSFDQDTADFVNHEICIKHLNSSQWQSLEKHLSQWDTMSSSPDWKLRKASILAERYGQKKTQILVEQVLSESRTVKSEENYYLRSIEGACVFFLDLLASERELSPNGQKRIVTGVEERLIELSKIDCDPREIYSGLKSKVEVEEFETSAIDYSRKWNYGPLPTFDDGWSWPGKTMKGPAANMSCHDSLRFCRAIEDLAIPIKIVGDEQYVAMGVAAGTYKKAAIAISNCFLRDAIAPCLRIADTDILNKTLGKGQIAALSDDAINDLFIDSKQSVDELIELSGSENESTVHSPSLDRLAFAVDVLSRTIVRLTSDKVRQASATYIRLLKNLNLTGNRAHQIRKSIGRLASRIVDSADRKILPELLLQFGNISMLPSFPTQNDSELFELDLVRYVSNEKVQLDFDTSNSGVNRKNVRKLIRCIFDQLRVDEEHKKEVHRCLAWLSKLDAAGQLKDEEQKTFARLAVVKQETHPGFFYDSYVAKLEKRYLQQSNVEETSSEVVSEFELDVRGIVDVLNLTKLPWYKSKKDLRIRWKKPLEKRILKKCSKWIRKEEFQNIPRHMSSDLDRIELLRRMMLAVEGIAIDRGSESNARELFGELVAQLKTKRLSTIEWRVCEIFKSKSTLASNSREIKAMINDAEESVRGCGFEAFQKWSKRQDIEGFGEVPTGLIEAICCVAISEEQVSRIEAMDSLRLAAESLSQEQRLVVAEMTKVFVQKLVNKTMYLSKEQVRVSNSELRWFPKTRLKLAKFLAVYCRLLEVPPSEFIETRDILKADCLATVRFAAES